MTSAGTMTSVPSASLDHPAGPVSRDDTGLAHLLLTLENVRCANCIRSVEEGIRNAHDIVSVRLNFSTRRLHIIWRPEAGSDEDAVHAFMETLERLGFPAKPVGRSDMADRTGDEERHLLRCMAVAGFASANIMLLSVSVWSGVDMGPATRDLMHWISGLIAIPAVAFAGRPFFRSALAALRAGRINMDVPISLAVILALGMSVFKTAQSGTHAYFDASVMLLFFLLIGRFLDQRMRGKARSAAQDLLALQTISAQRIEPDGSIARLPVGAIGPGDELLVPQGERIPVDGVLLSERAQFDVSLLTGESVPQTLEHGEPIYAGAVNQGAAVKLRAEKSADTSLVAEITRLMETAEQGRARYVRMADKAASIYAPTVHLLALATFIAWWALGGSWMLAAENAIAVLIITCPCALGLAVPVVQVVASGALFRKGILVKSADGLERLARTDYAVFDKTGTLTAGELVLTNKDIVSAEDLGLAATLARASHHPLSRAIAAAAGPGPVLEDLHEEPGYGLRAQTPNGEVRLGNALWCGAEDKEDYAAAGPVIWMRRPDGTTASFTFTDRLRSDAGATIGWIKNRRMGVELLSGDRAPAVGQAAETLGIDRWQARLTPSEKTHRLKTLAEKGRRVLMVGDGLNDAPSLASAYASISPSTAADISQTAADIVFQGEKLGAVATALKVARAARTLVIQNFSIAGVYNMIAIPLAVSGYVTPLIAAIAMSASSIVVTLNALRLPVMAGLNSRNKETP